MDELKNKLKKKLLKYVIMAVAPLFIVILIVIVPLVIAGTFFEGIKSFFSRKDELDADVEAYIEEKLDPEMYDVEAAKAWAIGDDDLSVLMQLLVEKYRDKVMADDFDASNPDVKKELKEDENLRLLYDILREDNVYLDDANIASIYQQTFDYNMRMFEWENVFYEYFGYEHEEVYEKDLLGNVIDHYWHWIAEEHPTDTDSDDRWGLATREKIEGEEDGTGKKRFQIHWQDIMAFAMYFGYQNIEEYENNKEDSAYVPNEGIYKVNDTARYYMKDDELQYIFDLFKYEFDYANEPGGELGYDVVGGLTPNAEDGKDHNTESTMYNWDESFDEPRKLKEGNYTVAYRYEREWPGEPAGFKPQTHYNTEEEMESPPVHTYMTPEASLLQINNSWDHWVYQYIPTSEVPDYTPDPENYEPPEGQYCVGRWHYVDPYKFIMSMGKFCPEYRDRLKSQEKNGKAGQSFLDHYQGGYEWSYQMIDFYCMYLEMFEEGGLNTRSSYFFELEELFRHIRDTGEIEVSYEGVAVEPEQLESMKKEIALSIVKVDPYVKTVIFQDGSFAHVNAPDGDVTLTPPKYSMKGNEDDGASRDAEQLSDGSQSRAAIPYSQADLDAMIRTVVGEAGNQGLDGMKTIAEVIYNRTISDRFPDTVQGVCTAGDGKQFNGWKNHEHDNVEMLKKQYPGCEDACIAILNGGKSSALAGPRSRLENPADIIGFRSDKCPDPWNGWSLLNSSKIKGHFFYSTANVSNPERAEASDSYRKGSTPEESREREEVGGEVELTEPLEMAGENVITWEEELELRYSHETGNFSFASLGVTFRQATDPDEKYDYTWPEDPYGRDPVYDEDFTPPEDAVFLDMWKYWNQAAGQGWADHKRGTSGETVHESGCLDLSLMMIMEYYVRHDVNYDTDLSPYVPGNGQLNGNAALVKYGLHQSGNNYSGFKEGCVSEIGAGRPVVLHVRYKWVAEDGTVLHSNPDSGHFLVGMGYDSEGMYVYDPGKRANRHIKWSDWDRAQDHYYRSVTGRSESFFTDTYHK
jgi:hypothetical protein